MNVPHNLDVLYNMLPNVHPIIYQTYMYLTYIVCTLSYIIPNQAWTVICTISLFEQNLSS
jgi:hypothetical protein